jgi:hypothetical protein
MVDNEPASSATNSKDKKIGHREVKGGVVHYKKVSSDELKKSIQFSIVHFIGEQNRKDSPFNIDRDLLMQDFQVVETIVFPKYDASIFDDSLNLRTCLFFELIALEPGPTRSPRTTSTISNSRSMHRTASSISERSFTSTK